MQPLYIILKFLTFCSHMPRSVFLEFFLELDLVQEKSKNCIHFLLLLFLELFLAKNCFVNRILF